MKQKLFYLLAAFAMLVAVVPAYAGDLKDESQMIPTKTGSEYGYSMNEMWYVSLGIGPNLLMASQDGIMAFGDRITFGGGISIGKWFNPGLGLRLQGYYGQYTGWNFNIPQMGTFTHDDGTSYFPKNWPDMKYKEGKNGEEGFLQEFNGFSFTLDFTANLTKLISGYGSEPTHFELIAFAGPGIYMSSEADVKSAETVMGGHFGGRVNYTPSLGGKLAIFFEANGTFMDDKFDGYLGDKGFDASSAMMVGVQYTF